MDVAMDTYRSGRLQRSRGTFMQNDFTFYSRNSYRPIPTRSWYGLAHHRRLASPQWPKRLVLPREGVSWELPKTPNVEKEKKKVGVGSVAPHHLAKASPLWIWRSFREDVLSPFGMVAKAVRLHSVHELLRVVLSAQNTRAPGRSIVFF